MPLVIQCPQCRKSAQIAEQYVGRQVRCPACRNVFAAQPVVGPTSAAVNATSPRANSPSSKSNGSWSPSPSKSSISTSCPACKAKLVADNSHCLDCGWMKADADVIQADAQPLFCTNPACGVANPISERYCQRCNTMLPSAPGTLLNGRYRVERLLAMGGFGAVYLATDVKANRAVAIKDMIGADPQEFSLRLSFFRREAEMLRALDNQPIVPRVYEFIEQGQSAHLVMEYIPGQDLLKIMETNGGKPFPLDLVVEWGKNVCQVLQQMHSLNPPVVHRDVKPDNLMLLGDGKTIRLIDFGTARDMVHSPRSKPVAATRVYTEGYAPPEQIIGKPEVRSDLFALAGTLYHLATGKAPEGYYTGRELETQLKNGNGGIAVDQKWFYELLKINLAEDANDRYFTAREFLTDLSAKKLTQEVVCNGCKQVNKVREPYCVRCAQPLTQSAPPCRQCARINRMGSRFCIYCGQRLR